MQKVEDLPPPTDPWMIRLYQEHPDIAYRLDALCIEIAHANGHDYVRDPEPTYTKVSAIEIEDALNDLFWTSEEEWPKVFKKHYILRPDELRLLYNSCYNSKLQDYPGLRERIHAWSKAHTGEFRNELTKTRHRRQKDEGVDAE